MTSSKDMSNSLVSAPVLGFDLVRLPGGAGVADLLLRVMDVTAVSLHSVGRYDRPNSTQIMVDVAVAQKTRRELRRQSKYVATAYESRGAVYESHTHALALSVIEQSPLGDLDGLLGLLRGEVLGNLAGHEALTASVRAMSDAATGFYLQGLLPVDSFSSLTVAWQHIKHTMPLPTDLGPRSAEIINLLASIRVLVAIPHERLQRICETTRRNLSDWAPAVHSASWAVFLANRVRTAACAQLMLVKAIDETGVSLTMRAGGLWNILSGAVQAMVVGDMLDGATYYRLVDPARAMLG